MNENDVKLSLSDLKMLKSLKKLTIYLELILFFYFLY